MLRVSVIIIFATLLLLGGYMQSVSSKKQENAKTLISVDIYNISNPEKIITLRPQTDSSLIGQCSNLLLDQVPDDDISGSNYEIIVFFSDGLQELYSINSTQTELMELCNRILDSSYVKSM